MSKRHTEKELIDELEKIHREQEGADKAQRASKDAAKRSGDWATHREHTKKYIKENNKRGKRYQVAIDELCA